jgi:hypothetical protein
MKTFTPDRVWFNVRPVAGCRHRGLVTELA